MRYLIFSQIKNNFKILFLLFMIFCFHKKSYSKEFTIVDQNIFGRVFRVTVINSHKLNCFWNGHRKILYSKENIFTKNIYDYKKNNIIEYENNIFKFSKILFVLNDSNVFLFLPNINSNICMLGLTYKNDSVFSWHFDNISSVKSNILTNIPAPSVVVFKHVNNATILFGSSNLYIDIKDSVPVVCSFVTALNASSDNRFYLDMKYPVIIDSKYNYDIWDDDVKYYKKIIHNKIMNPITLFTEIK